MRRWILTFASLAVIALWLVLAYVPSLPRPTLAYPAWSFTALALLAACGLLAFLLIQGWLVRTTDAALSGKVPPEQVIIQSEFQLHRGLELIWTALPILMTVVLAGLAFSLWRSLLA